MLLDKEGAMLAFACRRMSSPLTTEHDVYHTTLLLVVDTATAISDDAYLGPGQFFGTLPPKTHHVPTAVYPEVRIRRRTATKTPNEDTTWDG